MDQKFVRGFLKSNGRLIIIYTVFAIVQFSFFWGLCHLMPGERYYQRKARIRAGMQAPPPVIDSRIESQIPNFETAQGHLNQIQDELQREGQLPERPTLK